MNDTASGFAGINEAADMRACAELVIERLKASAVTAKPRP